MKIGITSDHRGYDLKELILKEYKRDDVELIDYGTNSEESVDYPDFAFKLATDVRDKKVDFGLTICGSGFGMSIACNKVKGIRCARVKDVEDVIITRNDNDANIIAFSGRSSLELSIAIINRMIDTPFSNAERHTRRIKKITEYEENN